MKTQRSLGENALANSQESSQESSPAEQQGAHDTMKMRPKGPGRPPPHRRCRIVRGEPAMARPSLKNEFGLRVVCDGYALVLRRRQPQRLPAAAALPVMSPHSLAPLSVALAPFEPPSPSAPAPAGIPALHVFRCPLPAVYPPVRSVLNPFDLPAPQFSELSPFSAPRLASMRNPKAIGMHASRCPAALALQPPVRR